MQMQIELIKRENILVVNPLESRLDAKMAVGFKDKMTSLIKEGNSQMVLNLSKVDFVDSSGLGAIVSVLKLMGREGQLVISGAQEKVMSMFKLTRMNRVFKVFDSEEEAIAALT